MTLETHLPPDLRVPTTTITPIAAGLSGAAVYRVDAAPFYQQLRSGALTLGTAEGLWTFGLALLKESLAA